MARGSNLESIDIRIAKAEAEVSKAKARYEKATADLKDLLDKRDAVRRDQLMKLIADSNRSYEEIVAFLKGNGEVVPLSRGTSRKYSHRIAFNFFRAVIEYVCGL